MQPYLKPQSEWLFGDPNSPGRIRRGHLDELGFSHYLEQLEGSRACLEPILSRCIRFGVAIRHVIEFTFVHLRSVLRPSY